MFQKKTIAIFCMLLTSASSHAELSFPTEPPSVQQVQTPLKQDEVIGSAVPIIIEQKAAKKNVDDKTSKEVKALIKQTLSTQHNVVLLPIAIKKTENQAGEARNIATAPIDPQLHIEIEVAPLESPMIGASYSPITLQLKDKQGKVIKTQTFDYNHAEQAKFIAAIEKMLAPHTGNKRPTSKIPAPQLKTWIETKDGKPVKLGGGLAIYFQPDTKGYVSLYYFDSVKNVQRLYPNQHEPVNFVQPGVTYRYPTKGFLTVKGKEGDETIKAIFTRWSSNMPRIVDGLKSKSAPLNIIPTHYPVLFATDDMTRFFALPKTHYTESHLKYTITK
jgi:hypothetical protein